MSTWQGRKLCRPYTGRKVLLEALYLGRRLTACPRLLNCPALSAQISCPGRLAGTAGNLARPMLVRQTMKLCRPYRTECFIRGLIPGAAPDGLPQAIELSCAFSADLVSWTRWDRRESCPPDARARVRGSRSGILACQVPTGVPACRYPPGSVFHGQGCPSIHDSQMAVLLAGVSEPKFVYSVG